MTTQDATVRRLAPAVFSIVVGLMAGWLALRAMTLTGTDRSSFFTGFVVLAVLSSLFLDVSLDRVAHRFGLPRTVVVPVFVSSVLLAAAGPLLLYAIREGLVTVSEAGAFWLVMFTTLFTYVAVGVAVGRVLRIR